MNIPHFPTRRFASIPTFVLCALLAAIPAAFADDQQAIIAVADAYAKSGKHGSTNEMPFVVTRTGSTDFDVVVRYRTIDGTATAGTDYEATAGQLTIPAGESSATIAVPILASQGGSTKANLTFTLELMRPTAAVQGERLQFQPAAEYTSGNAPVAQGIADFDGDGRNDIMLAASTDAAVHVLRNQTSTGAATPSFTDVGTYSTGGGPVSIAIGDLNNDGKPDAVIGNEDVNTLTVLINTTADGSSDISFKSTVLQMPGYGWTMGVTIGDFNSDGKPDIAAANPGSYNVSGTQRVLLLVNQTEDGASTPSFADTQEIVLSSLSYPYIISSGDYNGDGKPDIAVAGRDADTVDILLNTSTVGSSTAAFAAPTAVSLGTADNTAPATLITADMDGDGRPDLVTELGVLLNQTTTNATAASFVASPIIKSIQGRTSVAVGDFNQDGTPDIAISDNDYEGDADGALHVYLNESGPKQLHWLDASTLMFADEPLSVDIADFNGDGYPDLVSTDSALGTTAVFLQVGSPEALLGDAVATGTINFCSGSACSNVSPSGR